MGKTYVVAMMMDRPVCCRKTRSSSGWTTRSYSIEAWWVLLVVGGRCAGDVMK